MSAQNDFHSDLDRAANAVLDAAIETRAAGQRPLEDRHRFLIRAAVTHLEQAQHALFLVRNDPVWFTPEPRQPQFELLISGDSHRR
jgi:hypothetical protein